MDQVKENVTEFSDRFIGTFYFWLTFYNFLFKTDKAAFQLLQDFLYIIDNITAEVDADFVEQIKSSKAFKSFVEDITQRSEFVQLRDMKKAIEMMKGDNEKVEKIKAEGLNLPQENNPEEINKFIEELNAKFDKLTKDIRDQNEKVVNSAEAAKVEKIE